MNIPIGIYGDSFSVTRNLVIDTFNHTFVDGVSGVGKSTLLEDVAIQLIHAGKPLLYMDPHGTSARRILGYIPKRYSGRVVYINLLAKKVPGISVFCGDLFAREPDRSRLASRRNCRSHGADSHNWESVSILDGSRRYASPQRENWGRDDSDLLLALGRLTNHETYHSTPRPSCSATF